MAKKKAANQPENENTFPDDDEQIIENEQERQDRELTEKEAAAAAAAEQARLEAEREKLEAEREAAGEQFPGIDIDPNDPNVQADPSRTWNNDLLAYPDWERRIFNEIRSKINDLIGHAHANESRSRSNESRSRSNENKITTLQQKHNHIPVDHPLHPHEENAAIARALK